MQKEKELKNVMEKIFINYLIKQNLYGLSFDEEGKRLW